MNRPPRDIVQTDLQQAERQKSGSRDRSPATTPSRQVEDSDTRENAAAREVIANSPQGRKLRINEGGRAHDSSETRNPPGAVHGLPQPSRRDTGR